MPGSPDTPPEVRPRRPDIVDSGGTPLLPDYPELKAVLRERLNKRLQLQIEQHMGILQVASRRVMYEGDALAVVREDGTVDESDLSEAHAEFGVDPTDIETLAPAVIVEKFDQLARQIAAAQERTAFDTLESVVAATGNVIDAKGRSLSAELWLEALERQPLEFGRDGLPHMPTIAVHKDVVEKAREELARLEQEPELRAKLTEILEQKRVEWRHRESDRKLVE